MSLRFAIIPVLLFFYLPAFAAQESPQTEAVFTNRVMVLKAQLKQKQTSTDALEEKINSCKKSSGRGGSYSCDGWNGLLTTAKDIDKWKDELNIQKRQAGQLVADIQNAQAGKNLTAPAAATLNNIVIDSKLLMTDINLVKSSLIANGSEIQALNLKLDQSLLGEYTKYAIDQNMKSAESKKAVCETVSTCADTKKTGNSINLMNKKIQSFEEFKKSQLIQQRSAASAASQSSKSEGNGVNQ